MYTIKSSGNYFLVVKDGLEVVREHKSNVKYYIQRQNSSDPVIMFTANMRGQWDSLLEYGLKVSELQDANDVAFGTLNAVTSFLDSNTGFNYASNGGGGGDIVDSFEVFNKNLKDYPYQLNYVNGDLSTLVYSLGDGQFITKTLNFNNGLLGSIVFSGDIPNTINTIKSFVYDGNDVLTNVTYS